MQIQTGRYILERELGRGAAGIVYLARDTVIGRQVAIKRLTLSGGDSHQLLAEARLAGTLSHRNIICVYDAALTTDGAYIAMEYVAGRDLGTVMQDQPLPLDNKLRLLDGIAAALDHAHQRGIVHRDIKPANILVSLAGEAKIGDFGVATAIHEPDAGTHREAGTPGYLAPEQLTSAPVTPQTDQYALALVAYEWLSGARPFADASLPALLHRTLHMPPTPISQQNTQLSTAFDPVFSKALAKTPHQRFPSCAAFLAALRQAAAQPVVRNEVGSEQWLAGERFVECRFPAGGKEPYYARDWKGQVELTPLAFVRSGKFTLTSLAVLVTTPLLFPFVFLAVEPWLGKWAIPLLMALGALATWPLHRYTSGNRSMAVLALAHAISAGILLAASAQFSWSLAAAGPGWLLWSFSTFIRAANVPYCEPCNHPYKDAVVAELHTTPAGMLYLLRKGHLPNATLADWVDGNAFPGLSRIQLSLRHTSCPRCGSGILYHQHTAGEATACWYAEPWRKNEVDMGRRTDAIDLVDIPRLVQADGVAAKSSTQMGWKSRAVTVMLTMAIGLQFLTAILRLVRNNWHPAAPTVATPHATPSNQPPPVPAPPAPDPLELTPRFLDITYSADASPLHFVIAQSGAIHTVALEPQGLAWIHVANWTPRVVRLQIHDPGDSGIHTATLRINGTRVPIRLRVPLKIL
ncbi:MAG: serine/threonine protein kinase [Bryobacterales bacterium]|nr:serine/threonine protein kinase [Bryobacterales bacterium]